MQTNRFEKIGKVLYAMKRAETAKLKAKLTEIAQARHEAVVLRNTSAGLSVRTTAVEMQFQSMHQRADEAKARSLEQEALESEHEARAMQAQLAVTLGREQAANSLATAARKTQRETLERRAEAVPFSPRRYRSNVSAGSSEASSVGAE